MSKAIQRRRGTTAEHAGFTGLVGELTVDTTKNTVVVHDGVTAGGHPLAKENHNHDTTYASKAHESSTSAHPEMTATDAEVDAGTGSKWVKVSQLIRATVKTISSILPITLGGTGASTPEGARTNLGLGSVATENTVPVAKGGTGATTASAARANLGLGDAATRSVASTSTGAEDSGKLPALDATGKLPSGFIPTVEVSYVSEAGHASTADHATTAGSADTATSATTADSATNADKVDGYHASQTPNPNTVPVADAAGKLDAGWLPAMEAASVGGFYPSETPGASKIPVADSAGKLDGAWLPTINADTVDGYHAQKTAAVDMIPVAGPDGKLDNNWLKASTTAAAGSIPIAGASGKLDSSWLDIGDFIVSPGSRILQQDDREVRIKNTTYPPAVSNTTAQSLMVELCSYPANKVFVMPYSGEVTVSIDIGAYNKYVYARVLRNGRQVQKWSHAVGLLATKTCNVTVSKGDVINLQVRGESVMWRNGRILVNAVP